MKPGTLSGTRKKKPAWGDMPYHFYIRVPAGSAKLSD